MADYKDEQILAAEAGADSRPSCLLRIRYHADIDRLCYIGGKSDWIDLRAAEDVTMKAGEFRLISLGISVQIPSGYEMIIAPRSSTFRRYGILQANSIGIVDESYCGDGDIVCFPAYATRDCEIRRNDRICQFRLLAHQPPVRFEEAETLGNADRGGFGSTGAG